MTEETIFDLLHSAVVDYVVQSDGKASENSIKADAKVLRKVK